jgi:hypothetical protein
MFSAVLCALYLRSNDILKPVPLVLKPDDTIQAELKLEIHLSGGFHSFHH